MSVTGRKPLILEDLRERYTGEACTLNGKPAIVSGRKLAFAVVAALDGTCSAEFAWATVGYVLTAQKRRFLT